MPQITGTLALKVMPQGKEEAYGKAFQDMLRLKSYLRVPPGSFRYKQDEWGLHVGSNIEHLADELMEWRKGNNKPRATFGEALEDIENFTVAALGNNAAWVYSTDKEFRVLRPRSGLGCSTCGAVVK